jgi:hypothetical protein
MPKPKAPKKMVETNTPETCQRSRSHFETLLPTVALDESVVKRIGELNIDKRLKGNEGG